MSKRALVLASLCLGSIVACSVEPVSEEGEPTGSASSALKKDGTSVPPIVVAPPPPPPPCPPPPPVGGPIVPIVGDLYLDPGTPGPRCLPAVLEGNRPNRSCGDLPGAIAAGADFVLPAAGGSWRITSLFPNAPAAVRDHACRYTWQAASNSTCATPDQSVLLLETGTPESRGMQKRSPGCVTTSNACPSAGLPHLPGGGSCEVCGFVFENRMYAIVPDYWTLFEFELGGAPRRTVAASGDQVIVPLSSSYAPASVTIFHVVP